MLAVGCLIQHETTHLMRKILQTHAVMVYFIAEPPSNHFKTLLPDKALLLITSEVPGANTCAQRDSTLCGGGGTKQRIGTFWGYM